MNDYYITCESCGKKILRSQAQDISGGEEGILMCEDCYKSYTTYQITKETPHE